MHLKSAYSWDIASGNGDIRNINYFMVIGAFILLMAWVNYINMSTARAMQRAKEVGIRKSIGAYKGQLISQFIVESAIINSLAGLLAIGITLLLLPLLSGLVGKEIAPTVLNSMDSWQVFMAVLAAGSVLSGLYPAFVLSSFGPVSAHKSGVVAANGSAKPRKVLITFQFFVSVLLITGTWLVYQQISFMKAQDLGMDIDEVLVVNGPRVALESHAMEIGTFHKVFKTEATNHHSISAVTAITNVPGMGYFASESMRRKGDLAGQEKVVNVIFADPDFVDVLDLKMVAGEPLKGSRAENPSYRLKSNIVVYKWLVLNEEAVRLFDLGTPQQAINKELVLFGDTSVVVGVIKNPNWSSLRDTYAPMVFPIDDESAVYFSVKMHTSDIQESISYVEQAFHAAFPNDPFEYFFLDDAFNRQYQTDQQFGNLFTAFSVLAIFISCLGLFALVSFSASLKAKEIGIRKVLGASVGQLMALLSKEYLVLLLIASLLAVPLAIWGGQQWLENYAFRIEMGVEFIVIPAFLLLIVSVLTVSHSTWKAASANPVDSLKAE
ncbi:MAG: FtsX-like permease family protein [Imperialibacter sp.]